MLNVFKWRKSVQTFFYCKWVSQSNCFFLPLFEDFSLKNKWCVIVTNKQMERKEKSGMTDSLHSERLKVNQGILWHNSNNRNKVFHWQMVALGNYSRDHECGLYWKLHIQLEKELSIWWNSFSDVNNHSIWKQ